MTKQDFIDVLRSYIGTKFAQQGRIPNDSLDCGGLLYCATKQIGVNFEDLSGYTVDQIKLDDIINTLERSGCYSVEFDNVEKGDILLLTFNTNTQHICIVTETHPHIYIIHCIQNRGVCEHRLTQEFKNKIRRVFRFNI